MTVYRQVDTFDDGPCNIKAYVEMPKWEASLMYTTVESYDQEVILNLLSIKKEAKSWKNQSDCGCDGTPRGHQWGSIPNMFVIEKPRGNDTIYTNHNNTQVIFPEQQTAYHDEKGLFAKAFNGNIKEFFNHDFSTQIRSLFYAKENDSITTDKILYNGKPVIEIFNENFDKHPGNFRKIRETPLDNDTEKTYTLDNDTIEYYFKKIKITITSPDSRFKVGRFKVGDTEEKLITQYPVSTRVQKFYNIRYEDILRKYFYWVILSDNQGIITYFIKDHLIEKIEIDL